MAASRTSRGTCCHDAKARDGADDPGMLTRMSRSWSSLLAALLWAWTAQAGKPASKGPASVAVVDVSPAVQLTTTRDLHLARGTSDYRAYWSAGRLVTDEREVDALLAVAQELYDRTNLITAPDVYDATKPTVCILTITRAARAPDGGPADLTLKAGTKLLLRATEDPRPDALTMEVQERDGSRDSSLICYNPVGARGVTLKSLEAHLGDSVSLSIAAESMAQRTGAAALAYLPGIKLRAVDFEGVDHGDCSHLSGDDGERRLCAFYDYWMAGRRVTAAEFARLDKSVAHREAYCRLQLSAKYPADLLGFMPEGFRFPLNVQFTLTPAQAISDGDAHLVSQASGPYEETLMLWCSNLPGGSGVTIKTLRSTLGQTFTVDLPEPEAY
jgi:hypothetical protein